MQTIETWLRISSRRYFVLLSVPMVMLLFLQPVLGDTKAGSTSRAVVYDFSIKAQDLSSALQAFARQANVDILYSGEAVEKSRSPAVSGRYSVEEVLRLLLKNTRLTYVVDKSGAIAVVFSQTTPLLGTEQGTNSNNMRKTGATGTELATGETQTGNNKNKETGTGTRSQERVIEEIVVTAQKREENLQDTPIAITAISKQLIDERALFTINEVARYVPNLSTSPAASGAASSASLNIRGIGQSDFITTTDPGVAMYLDGVYLSRITGSAIELADIERIEILRGPQGTLFGRNTAGGAVNVITAKPGNELGGKIEVSAGAFTEEYRGKLNSRLSLDLPLGEKLAANINLMGKTSEGWGKNNAPGRAEKLGQDGDIAGRLAVYYQLSDELNLYLTYDRSHRRGSAMPHGQVSGPLAIADDNPELVAFNGPSDDELDVWGVALTVNWRFNDIHFRSITAYRDQEGELGQDFDGSTLTFIDQFIDLRQDQISQEFQLFGTSLAGKLDWLTGLYYFKEDAGFLTETILGGAAINIDTFSGTESYAAFGQISYHLTEKLSVTSGLRFTDEKKDVDVATVFGLFPLVPRSRLDESFQATTPKAGIEFRPSENAMLYASFTKGFRSGGFNGRPFAPTDLLPFDEEINTSYELGAKLDLFDRRLRLNLAGFYTEYDDIQLTATTLSAGGGFIVVTDNAGKADIYGFELEAQWLVSDSLELFGALGLTELDQIEAKTGFTFNPATVGNTLPNASEVNSMLGFVYSFPLSRFDARLGADWSYRSEYFHQINNSILAQEDGYHLINTQLSLVPVNNEKWKFMVYGKNLTNAVYRAYGQEAAGFGVTTAWFVPTRELGMRVNYSF